jgi:hypothetical protein
MAKVKIVKNERDPPVFTSKQIGWTDVGSGGYIIVSCARSNTSYNMCNASQDKS